MTGRSPAGPLMHEHRLIERMIGVLGVELDAAERSGRVDTVAIADATDFIRTYADRCHHGKEEDILFARLADKPLEPDLADEMEGLIQDHVYGRTLTRQLVGANGRYAAGEESALGEIVPLLRALAEFYPVHIEREDHHFFKPCLEYFSEAERVQMLADFDEFDRALIHQRYREVVERLESRARARA